MVGRFYTEKERISTSKGQAVILYYNLQRDRYEVCVEYDDLTLTDWPIRYKDGRVAYDHPEPLTCETKDFAYRMLEMLALSPQGEWRFLCHKWRQECSTN